MAQAVATTRSRREFQKNGEKIFFTSTGHVHITVELGTYAAGYEQGRVGYLSNVAFESDILGGTGQEVLNTRLQAVDH